MPMPRHRLSYRPAGSVSETPRYDVPVLGSIGVQESDLDALTELALADPFHTVSPEPWSAVELRGALQAALAEEAW